MSKKNAVRKSIEQGNTVYGARVVTMAPQIVEVYGDLGLDFAWLDFEHMGPSALDNRVIEDLTRAADSSGISLLLRLPSGDPETIRKVLDCGVRNVLIPRIRTAAEVREAVKAAYYEYDGGSGARGAGTSRAGNWGNRPRDYVEREDESVFVGCMIENREAVENLDEILSVPGLGFIYLGPGDLSISIGRPLETRHPAVQELLSEVEGVAKENGIPVGKGVSSSSGVHDATDEDYQLLRIGDELNAVREVLGDRMSVTK